MHDNDVDEQCEVVNDIKHDKIKVSKVELSNDDVNKSKGHKVDIKQEKIQEKPQDKVNSVRIQDIIDNLEEESEIKSKSVVTKEPYLELCFKKRKVQALVDTGAQVSALTKEMLDELKEDGEDIQEVPVRVLSLTGALREVSKPIGKKILLEFKVNGRRFDQSFCVLRKFSQKIVLGMDFIRDNQMMIQCSEQGFEMLFIRSEPENEVTSVGLKGTQESEDEDDESSNEEERRDKWNERINKIIESRENETRAPEPYSKKIETEEEKIQRAKKRQQYKQMLMDQRDHKVISLMTFNEEDIERFRKEREQAICPKEIITKEEKMQDKAVEMSNETEKPVNEGLFMTELIEQEIPEESDIFLDAIDDPWTIESSYYKTKEQRLRELLRNASDEELELSKEYFERLENNREKNKLRNSQYERNNYRQYGQRKVGVYNKPRNVWYRTKTNKVYKELLDGETSRKRDVLNKEEQIEEKELFQEAEVEQKNKVEEIIYKDSQEKKEEDSGIDSAEESIFHEGEHKELIYSIDCQGDKEKETGHKQYIERINSSNNKDVTKKAEYNIAENGNNEEYNKEDNKEKDIMKQVEDKPVEDKNIQGYKTQGDNKEIINVKNESKPNTLGAIKAKVSDAQIKKEVYKGILYRNMRKNQRKIENKRQKIEQMKEKKEKALTKPNNEGNIKENKFTFNKDIKEEETQMDKLEIQQAQNNIKDNDDIGKRPKEVINDQIKEVLKLRSINNADYIISRVSNIVDNTLKEIKGSIPTTIEERQIINKNRKLKKYKQQCREIEERRFKGRTKYSNGEQKTLTLYDIEKEAEEDAEYDEELFAEFDGSIIVRNTNQQNVNMVKKDNNIIKDKEICIITIEEENNPNIEWDKNMEMYINDIHYIKDIPEEWNNIIQEEIVLEDEATVEETIDNESMINIKSINMIRVESSDESEKEESDDELFRDDSSMSISSDDKDKPSTSKENKRDEGYKSAKFLKDKIEEMRKQNWLKAIERGNEKEASRTIDDTSEDSEPSSQRSHGNRYCSDSSCKLCWKISDKKDKSSNVTKFKRVQKRNLSMRRGFRKRESDKRRKERRFIERMKIIQDRIDAAKWSDYLEHKIQQFQDEEEEEEKLAAIASISKEDKVQSSEESSSEEKKESKENKCYTINVLTKGREEKIPDTHETIKKMGEGTKKLAISRKIAHPLPNKRFKPLTFNEETPYKKKSPEKIEKPRKIEKKQDKLSETKPKDKESDTTIAGDKTYVIKRKDGIIVKNIPVVKKLNFEQLKQFSEQSLVKQKELLNRSMDIIKKYSKPKRIYEEKYMKDNVGSNIDELADKMLKNTYQTAEEDSTAMKKQENQAANLEQKKNISHKEDKPKIGENDGKVIKTKGERKEIIKNEIHALQSRIVQTKEDMDRMLSNISKAYGENNSVITKKHEESIKIIEKKDKAEEEIFNMQTPTKKDKVKIVQDIILKGDSLKRPRDSMELLSNKRLRISDNTNVKQAQDNKTYKKKEDLGQQQAKEKEKVVINKKIGDKLKEKLKTVLVKENLKKFTKIVPEKEKLKFQKDREHIGQIIAKRQHIVKKDIEGIKKKISDNFIKNKTICNESNAKSSNKHEEKGGLIGLKEKVTRDMWITHKDSLGDRDKISLSKEEIRPTTAVIHADSQGRLVNSNRSTREEAYKVNNKNSAITKVIDSNSGNITSNNRNGNMADRKYEFFKLIRRIDDILSKEVRVVCVEGRLNRDKINVLLDEKAEFDVLTSAMLKRIKKRKYPVEGYDWILSKNRKSSGIPTHAVSLNIVIIDAKIKIRAVVCENEKELIILGKRSCAKVKKQQQRYEQFYNIQDSIEGPSTSVEGKNKENRRKVLQIKVHEEEAIEETDAQLQNRITKIFEAQRTEQEQSLNKVDEDKENTEVRKKGTKIKNPKVLMEKLDANVSNMINIQTSQEDFVKCVTQEVQIEDLLNISNHEQVLVMEPEIYEPRATSISTNTSRSSDMISKDEYKRKVEEIIRRSTEKSERNKRRERRSKKFKALLDKSDLVLTSNSSSEDEEQRRLEECANEMLDKLLQGNENKREATEVYTIRNQNNEKLVRVRANFQMTFYKEIPEEDKHLCQSTFIFDKQSVTRQMIEETTEEIIDETQQEGNINKILNNELEKLKRSKEIILDWNLDDTMESIQQNIETTLPTEGNLNSEISGVIPPENPELRRAMRPTSTPEERSAGSPNLDTLFDKETDCKRFSLKNVFH